MPVPVDENNHTDWNYTYQWNGTQCTAERICACGEAERETVQGQIVEITPATKTTAGKTICNAVFQNAEFEANKTDACTGYEAEVPAGTPFAITEGGKQHYAFDGIAASKRYYMEVQLGASAKGGYVGLAHWADAEN